MGASVIGSRGILEGPGAGGGPGGLAGTSIADYVYFTTTPANNQLSPGGALSLRASAAYQSGSESAQYLPSVAQGVQPGNIILIVRNEVEINPAGVGTSIVLIPYQPNGDQLCGASSGVWRLPRAWDSVLLVAMPIIGTPNAINWVPIGSSTAAKIYLSVTGVAATQTNVVIAPGFWAVPGHKASLRSLSAFGRGGTAITAGTFTFNISSTPTGTNQTQVWSSTQGRLFQVEWVPYAGANIGNSGTGSTAGSEMVLTYTTSGAYVGPSSVDMVLDFW